MPVFDFECTNEECDYEDERLIKRRDADVECPKCGAPCQRADRVYSHKIKYATDGFYTTDVKGEDYE